MPKGLLHIACSVLILLNGMGYSIIQAQFLLQRKEITAIYCINKDKPELQCEGKCELSKRLSEAKNQAENGEEVVLEELSLSYILPQISLEVKPEILHFSSPLHGFYQAWTPQEVGPDFFHPPTS